MVWLMNSLRLVTYNIHMGLSPFRKRNVLEAMETVLQTTKADILCLQEDLQVDDVTDTQMALRCQKVWGSAVFGRTVLHPRGAQGNSILSRFPIEFSEIVCLPCFNSQPRSLIRATVDCGWLTPIEIICVHFGLSARQRQAQAEATIDYVDRELNPNHPVFIAGDFNDWRGILTARFLRDKKFSEVRSSDLKTRFLTFPAWMPILPLDRIFYRGCEVVEARVFRDSGRLGKSDHLPIIADFRSS